MAPPPGGRGKTAKQPHAKTKRGTSAPASSGGLHSLSTNVYFALQSNSCRARKLCNAKCSAGRPSVERSMRILLVNVPHPAIGSRIPDDPLPPLGLLSIGGPLIDDGHEVRLLDGEFGPASPASLVAQAKQFAPDAVLFGHSGSTSGHPVIAEVARAAVLFGHSGST